MRPGDLVFDIGANIGQKTSVFLEVGARVVAVEPQPDCAARIDPRAIVEQTAVGARPGTIDLHVADAPVLSSVSADWIRKVKASGRFPDHTWDDTITVPMVTLDQLIARHGRPVFCKIDTEGYDAEVIAGLSQPIPSLCFEFSLEALEVAECAASQLDLIGDYEFSFTIAHGTRLAPRRARNDTVAALQALPWPEASWGDVYAWLKT